MCIKELLDIMPSTHVSIWVEVSQSTKKNVFSGSSWREDDLKPYYNLEVEKISAVGYRDFVISARFNND